MIAASADADAPRLYADASGDYVNIAGDSLFSFTYALSGHH